MTQDYRHIHDFMAQCALGDIYEIAHAQRVLCNSLMILDGERNAESRVVIAAALLHDIGRGDPEADHAASGSRKAYAFLRGKGYPEDVAAHVADCILTHRYASAERPRSNEAKILFDADKLDLLGAVGTARAIKHAVLEGKPFYTIRADGLPGPGKKDEPPSLLREYRKKLRKLPGLLFTETARKMAAQTRQAQKDFFTAFFQEAEHAYAEGARLLAAHAAPPHEE